MAFLSVSRFRIRFLRFRIRFSFRCQWLLAGIEGHLRALGTGMHHTNVESRSHEDRLASLVLLQDCQLVFNSLQREPDRMRNSQFSYQVFDGFVSAFGLADRLPQWPGTAKPAPRQAAATESAPGAPRERPWPPGGAQSVPKVHRNTNGSIRVFGHEDVF